MTQPTIDVLRGLLAEQHPPCISLYQPTHRSMPQKMENPIRYKNLLRQAQTALDAKYAAPGVQPIIDKLNALARDDAFWMRRTVSFAILASANRFELFDLQRSVPELVVVADSFHVKPLLRIVQSADRYHVLAVNRKQAKLFEGNRDALQEIDVENVPTTITDALGDQLTEPYQGFHGVGPFHASRGNAGVYHGRGQKKDEVDLDMERFFRIVDRGILEHYSRPTGLPLILAGLPHNVAGFRAVSRNPQILDAAIERDAESLSIDELRLQTWEQLEPIYLKRLEQLCDTYNLSRSRGLGADRVAEVAEAAVLGRVGTLLIDAERFVPGHVDKTTGRVERRDGGGRYADDVLDDLAETVVRMKGEAVVVPPERMPTKTGVAAIYRF